MKCSNFAILFVAIISLSSCITNKDLVYLQDDSGNLDTGLVVSELPEPYKVEVDDILSINVKALDPELVDIFNPIQNESANAQQGNFYFSGFVVDMHGNIEFPILGEIAVLGYTVAEIEDKVKEALLKQYFKDTAELYVTVKLAGLNYSMLGESPAGSYVIFQDRVNIIEAIANAGDLPDTADRKDVLVIRQYPGGQKIHHIDLTNISAMQSPYYYIQPNDIILVKPLKRKALGFGQTALQNLNAITSVLSIMVSLFLLTKI